MKKVLLLLCLTAVFFSCKNNEPYSLEYTHRKVIRLQVDPNEWQYSNIDNNNYFIAPFKIENLDYNVYQNGTVHVYREWNPDTQNAAQMQLPFIRLKEEYLGDDENGEQIWVNYTESVDFEYGYQYLNLVYTVSDFNYEIDTQFLPEQMYFRVVLMW